MNPYGMKAQGLGMAAMIGGPMIGQAMGGNTGMMIGMGLGQVASMLPFVMKGALTLSKIIKFTGYGALIASVVAAGKYLLDLKKKYEDVKRNANEKESKRVEEEIKLKMDEVKRLKIEKYIPLNRLIHLFMRYVVIFLLTKKRIIFTQDSVLLLIMLIETRH